MLFRSPIPERVAIAACSVLHSLHLGPLHPEQYLTIGKDFVLSIERTFDHFAWRPRFTDNQVIADSFRPFGESRARA